MKLNVIFSDTKLETVCDDSHLQEILKVIPDDYEIKEIELNYKPERFFYYEWYINGNEIKKIVKNYLPKEGFTTYSFIAYTEKKCQEYKDEYISKFRSLWKYLIDSVKKIENSKHKQINYNRLVCGETVLDKNNIDTLLQDTLSYVIIHDKIYVFKNDCCLVFSSINHLVRYTIYE